MQKKALTLALDKLGQGASTLDWLFAGDLLNQCIGSSFAAREQHIRPQRKFCRSRLPNTVVIRFAPPFCKHIQGSRKNKPM